MSTSTPKTFVLEKNWKENCDMQSWNGKITL